MFGSPFDLNVSDSRQKSASNAAKDRGTVDAAPQEIVLDYLGLRTLVLALDKYAAFDKLPVIVKNQTTSMFIRIPDSSRDIRPSVRHPQTARKSGCTVCVRSSPVPRDLGS